MGPLASQNSRYFTIFGKPISFCSVLIYKSPNLSFLWEKYGPILFEPQIDQKSVKCRRQFGGPNGPQIRKKIDFWKAETICYCENFKIILIPCPYGAQKSPNRPLIDGGRFLANFSDQTSIFGPRMNRKLQNN